MREFVLLLCHVVGLQRCRGDFDGVGEDLLALLNLPGFVGDGLFFVFDLRNGMTRLRRIEDDAGTELRLRCGCLLHVEFWAPVEWGSRGAPFVHDCGGVDPRLRRVR